MKRNGGTSQDIMMNLLGDSSDSDPELLNLPPLKGKKPKKKKSFDSDTSLCNLWAFLKMFFVLLLICAVSVLMVISFWLSGQVADLKQKLLDRVNISPGQQQSLYVLYQIFKIFKPGK